MAGHVGVPHALKTSSDPMKQPFQSGPWNVTAALLGLGLAVATLPLRAQDRLSGELLTQHALSAAALDEQLPGGAVLHLELRDLGTVLDALDALATAAVPTKLLPPDLQGLFEEGRPVRALLGYQTVGQPWEDEVLAARLGVHARQPLSLTLYPGYPPQSFVLSLPMADVEAMAEALQTALHPTAVESDPLANGLLLRLSLPQPQLPELYVVSAPERVFLCGGRGLAISLVETPPDERLARDPFVPRALKEAAQDDLRLVLNPRLLKHLVRLLPEIRPHLQQAVQEQRRRILVGIPAAQREELEHQLRRQLGVRDLDQLADYLQTAVVVTVDQLLDGATARVLAFEGISVGVRLDARFPELGIRIYSADSQPERATTPVDREGLLEALSLLGGGDDGFSAHGRQPAPEAHPLLRAWVQALRKGFAERGLQSRWVDRLAAMLEETRPEPRLEAELPWMVSARLPLQSGPSLEESPTLIDYFRQWQWPWRQRVWVVPKADPAFLADYWRRSIEVFAHNQELAENFSRQTTGEVPALDQDWRLVTEPFSPDGLRVVVESVLRTHGGWFGFDQHELVSRRIYHARRVGEWLVYHRGLADPEWLAGLQPPAELQPSPAVVRLLEHVPDGANRLVLFRCLHRLPGAVDWLARLEARLHKDADLYLAEVRRIIQETGPDEAAIRRALEGLPMPEALRAVCRDAEGRVYGLLPGNLVYPRPPLMPLVQELFAEFGRQAPALGGAVFYTRMRPGVFEARWIQNTEALTTLIASAGNTAAERLLSPEGQQEVLQRLQQPGDRDELHWEWALEANPLWDSLPRPPLKTDARPGHPIPPRPAGADARQVDLTPFYNASLLDDWHQGRVSNSLAALPSGLQRLDGVQFDLRGIIQLAGRAQVRESRARFPHAVRGIPVGHKARRLHFLHATGWSAPPDTTVGRYVVHYANGGSRTILLVYGRDLADWYGPPEETLAEELRVAWRAPSQSSSSAELRLFHLVWDNPLPEQPIDHIDFISAMNDPAPFLVALTHE